MDNFFRILKRFGRASVSILLAGIPAYYQNDPRYLLLAPILQAVGKWLRVVLNLKNIPV